MKHLIICKNCKINHFRKFGGWAAENIYYMGDSNIIDIKYKGNIYKLGGVSGIFKTYDFFKKGK